VVNLGEYSKAIIPIKKIVDNIRKLEVRKRRKPFYVIKNSRIIGFTIGQLSDVSNFYLDNNDDFADFQLENKEDTKELVVSPPMSTSQLRFS